MFELLKVILRKNLIVIKKFSMKQKVDLQSNQLIMDYTSQNHNLDALLHQSKRQTKSILRYPAVKVFIRFI